MSSDIEKNIKIFKRVTSIKEIDWYRVSIKSLLPESFIHDNMDFLDWAAISRYQKLSIPFIINHDKQVDWYFIVKKYDLPEPDLPIPSIELLFIFKSLSMKILYQKIVLKHDSHEVPMVHDE